MQAICLQLLLFFFFCPSFPTSGVNGTRTATTPKSKGQGSPQRRSLSGKVKTDLEVRRGPGPGQKNETESQGASMTQDLLYAQPSGRCQHLQESNLLLLDLA